MLTMDIPGFTSQDPKSENSYSESPYVYVSNNPLKYIDPDGREKLNGMGPKDDGDKKVERRRYINNDMIHIYSHGSEQGFGFYINPYREDKIRNVFDFQEFLEKYSAVWQTRQHGEKIYIMLHACHNGEDYIDPVDGRKRNFAREMSAQFAAQGIDVTIGAPSTTIQLDSQSEEVRDNITGKMGVWNFYENGEWIYSRKGDNGQSPDLLDYHRKVVTPQNGNNSTDKEKNGKEAREKAQKNWGTVRRSFYERFNF